MNHRFLIVALLLACKGPVGCEPNVNHTPPEIAAAKFAGDLGLNTRGKPSCAGVDTDNDGYVTCTIALGSADAPKLMSIQCAAVENSDGCTPTKYAQGCKETPIKAAVVQERQ
jgi:hypothetical protein